MNEREYFHTVNYTGNHLHVDNWKDESTPFMEGIAWERQDGSMDLFFEEFDAEIEIQKLFLYKGYYYEKVKGGYIGSAGTNQEAYAMFRKWIVEVLHPYRNEDK
ncbi:hypothetical protein [Mesobacillus zeae]|uniref:DUF3986 family protein n=1 Tax=Mesobacillus zeae TaxID=1917180 RepID=A0A398BBU9_9BACI|nr:hypothetical protein [Mesobacillus zeae]RID87525.1 hypothetical protein D1970_04980 [Mesobacillus zeae]